MHETFLIFVAVVLALIILVSTFYSQDRESFDPKYQTSKDTYSKNSFWTSSEEISHGTVQKYKNSDDEFVYELLYNLPTANAEKQTVDLNQSYNAPMPVEKYTVYASKDGKDMTPISHLSRRADGWHRLEFRSKEEYSKFCVVLGKTIVACTEIS